MADDAAENAASSGGKGKKLIIAIVAIVILLAGGGGAFLMLSGSDEATAVADEEQDAVTEEVAEESEEAEIGDAYYVGMPRPFVFNVSGYDRDRLVQIKVQLLVRGPDNDTTARKHIPLIEDTLLTVFSSSTAEKLATRVGKDELRTQSQNAVQKALEPIAGSSVIEKVLFIGFVMQ